jgi:hypothetical protein
LSLADIGAYLTRPDLPLATIVAQQMDMLTQQIDQATALRSRLSRLHGQLEQGQEPDLADWLTTLEHMTMYDKYFSQDELKQLPLYTQAETVGAEWKVLVGAVTELMASGAKPADAQSQELARQWMQKITRDTGANPVLFAKLNAMHAQEPAVQSQTGITPALMKFIVDAAHEGKLAIYRKYLSDDELAYMRENLGKRSAEWPPLIAQVRTAMDKGCAPDSPEVQALARHWYDLFRSFAGDDPQTQMKIRTALSKEPGLTDGGMVDAAMRDFIRMAMESLRPQ